MRELERDRLGRMLTNEERMDTRGWDEGFCVERYGRRICVLGGRTGNGRNNFRNVMEEERAVWRSLSI